MFYFFFQVAPEYVHGVTNKTEEFQSKFFGKVPAFESGATALCDDTAIAHFVGNQQTRGGEKTDQVRLIISIYDSYNMSVLDKIIAGILRQV